MPKILQSTSGLFTGRDAGTAVTEADLFPKRRGITEAHVLEAAQLLGRAFKGNRTAMTALQEALSSDDFKAAAFDVLERELMERYDDMPTTWRDYVSTTTVPDFKRKRLVDLMGGRAALDLVPELSPYPERDVDKALYYLAVAKYGGLFAFSWEALVNDDLDELRSLPENLAIAARDTESRAAAGLLTDGDGANGSYFGATAWGRTYDPDADSWSGGSSNLLSGNPALTIDSLADAIDEIRSRRDPEGRPIIIPGLRLVVPQAMETTAERVLATREVRTTVGGVETVENNWAAGKVQLTVDPWLDVLDQGADAATSWWLVPDAATTRRKAFFLGHLRGHEAPDLRVKADGGNMLGGGQVGAEEGSFDLDDIRYRVRHVVGTTGTDMIGTAFSDGSGA